MYKFEDRIRDICKRLDIPSEYESRYGLPIQYEEDSLVEIGSDIYNRAQYLSKEAAISWNKMRKQANEEGIRLEVVSAFRSVDKQLSIIERKLEQGQSISEILEVSAAPGYSEHHTGKAIDITTPSGEPLVESFELTEAYRWLNKNASLYSFYLSYPRDNSGGVAYEPWHWAYCK
ncbi:MAG: D-alanyl-D-alanine carboxypeptidase family protein [Thiotrichaceae bacterium]|nr:D-alanyl-D-alanine carboxypeptidase family protein [Thiotrichaceae bacterium]